jgi:ribosomal protein S19
MGLIKKLRLAKKAAPPNEKPAVVKTHLRDMIIVPEMIGSVVGIYNGKVFNSVEIKPEMTGHYLAEFSISYKPVKHGRPGIGATHCECSSIVHRCHYTDSGILSVTVYSTQVDRVAENYDSLASCYTGLTRMVCSMQYVNSEQSRRCCMPPSAIPFEQNSIYILPGSPLQ